MKKILVVLLLFLPVFLLSAQQKNNLDEFVMEIWQVNQRQAAVITNYKGSAAHVVIPEQINGYPVAGIGNNAFRSRHIESVQFPQTLVFVGEYAFYDNRLYAINLPPSVTTIGVGAFDNNSPAQNVAPSSSSAPATYTRTVTIEPAHSTSMVTQKPAASSSSRNSNVRSAVVEPAHSNSTVYVSPKPATSPSQTINIQVVPGYNPVDSTQQSYPLTGKVTTMQNYTLSAPAPASSYSAPPPVYSYSTPAPANYDRVPAATPQNTPYQLVTENENVVRPRTSSNKQFQLVSEGASGKLDVPIQPASELQLHKEEIQPMWQQPRPR
jgi:hypothetical protein